MTELLPKPKPFTYRVPPEELSKGMLLMLDDLSKARDYYKRLAEFAIEALERAQQKISGGDNYVLPDIEKALSTIKGSQS